VAAHGLGGTVRFEYDALGRRIAKKTETRQVRYVWCGEQVTREIITTSEGVETRDYLYMPATYQPLAMRAGDNMYFFHTNHEGTPERISDAAGQLVWSARYDGFGHAQIDIAKIDNPLRFPGQYYDNETGLHYNRFRYFSTRLGRYWSVDPLGLRGGEHNLYTYVGNDPINRVDPLGLWWKQAVSVVAGVAVAAAIVLTAPVSLPALAIGAIAVTAGVAVSAGLNEALTADHFCLPCLVRGFAKGAVFALLAIGAVAVGGELVAGALLVYGVYSAINLAVHWDNMTHEERMEAVGQVLGGVAIGLGAAGLGGPPPPGTRTGLAWAETPGGGRVLVPVTEPAPAVGAGTKAGAGSVAMSGSGDGTGSGEKGKDDPAEAESEQQREQALRAKSAEGDKNATRELNEIKARKAEKTGGDRRGPLAENKVLAEDGDQVVEAGREVEYPDPANPDEVVSSEIDNETTTHVNQVKAGKKMPSPTQAQATRLRAQEVGKKPAVQYDPNVMPPGAVRQFKLDNPDFDLQPRDLSVPEAEPIPEGEPQ